MGPVFRGVLNIEADQEKKDKNDRGGWRVRKNQRQIGRGSTRIDADQED
jgi:hypothetical protein